MADDDRELQADFRKAIETARAVLAGMSAQALERARAAAAVIDQADEIYTRLLVLKLVGKFVPPDDAVAVEFQELGNRLAKLDALGKEGTCPS